MPFQGNRVYYIAGIAVFIVIVGALAWGAISNANTAKNREVMGQISVTINYGVGIQEIDVTNQNTGELYQATLTDFPLRFNCTAEDNLNIKILTKPGYTWNAMWFSPMDIWCKGINNELTVIAGDGNYFGDIVDAHKILMTPKCNLAPVTVTPQPSVTPTASGWGESK